MTVLEHWYHITGNGKLTMRDRTPRECPEFRANLRRLMRARMNKQRGRNMNTNVYDQEKWGVAVNGPCSALAAHSFAEAVAQCNKINNHLRSTLNHKIHPGEQRIVPTGFGWQIPEGWVGMIRPRSGLSIRSRIDVRAGVVDSSFRGQVVAVLVNEGEEPLYIEAGQRIAQMVVVPHLSGPVFTVSQLGESDRGGEGFGSTGRK